MNPLEKERIRCTWYPCIIETFQLVFFLFQDHSSSLLTKICVDSEGALVDTTLSRSKQLLTKLLQHHAAPRHSLDSGPSRSVPTQPLVPQLALAGTSTAELRGASG